MNTKKIPVLAQGEGAQCIVEMNASEAGALRDGEIVTATGSGGRVKAGDALRYEASAKRFWLVESDGGAKTAPAGAGGLTADDERAIAASGVSRESFLATRERQNADRHTASEDPMAAPSTRINRDSIQVTLSEADEKMIQDYGLDRASFIKVRGDELFEQARARE